MPAESSQWRLDPNNWATAFVTDATNVYETTNQGESWQSITGNLSSSLHATPGYSVAVIPGTNADAVLVGGTGGGVFRMLTNNPGVWTAFGAGLPNAVIGDMQYSAPTDTLVVGTFGRGAWEIPNASATVFDSGTVDVEATNSTIVLRLDPANTQYLQVLVNNKVVFEAQSTALQLVEINMNHGHDTVDLEDVPAAITVLATNDDAVNVTKNGSASGIQGTVSIITAAGSTKLTVDDSTDTTVNTVTLADVAPGVGSITGLSSGTISYGYNSNSSLTLSTGDAANTIDVQTTGETTNLMEPINGDLLNPDNTVMIGNGGRVTGIVGTLNIQNSNSFDTITVDGSTGGTASPTVTLGTFIPAGDTTNWGYIKGLAPAHINYKYADTQSLTLQTGPGATINVLATGVTTSLVGSGDTAAENTTITVGNGGSLAGILGTLNMENPTGMNQITVDDSKDKKARTAVTLATFTPPGDGAWGLISGMSPAAQINYEYADTGQMTFKGGSGKNTYNVQAAGATTTLNTGAGNDTINLGNANSLLGVQAPVTITGQGGADKLNANDQADTNANLSGQPNVYSFTENAFTAAVFGGDALPQVVTVNYSNLAAIDFWAAQTVSPGNQIQVQGTSNGTATLAVHAGTAADLIGVAAPVITGGPTMGNLTVDGHGASVGIDDSGTQDITGDLLHRESNSVAFTSTDQSVAFSDQVTRFPPPGSHQPPVKDNLAWTMTYSNLQSLSINGGPVSTSFKVQSTASGTPVTITAGVAGNSFQIGKNDSVKIIRSLVTLTGQGATSTVGIDDSSATVEDQITVSNTAAGNVEVGLGAMDQFFGTGGGVDAADMSELTLNLSHAAGDVVHLAPSAVTAFSVNGNAAEYGAGHGAVLNLNLNGVSNPQFSGIPGTGVWTFGNRQSVTFSNMLMGASQATPTVQVNDAGGTYSGQPFPATATVTGTSGTPGSTLEGVGLTLDYQQVDVSGNVLADLGATAPTTAGRYQVIASFAGSTDYTNATSRPNPFTIGQATPLFQVSAASGDFNGQPVAVTATVAGVVSGVDNTPGPTLEGVGLTLQYFQVFSNGSLDSLFAPPTNAGNYQVIASFAGSTDYVSASSPPATFTIFQATPAIQVSAASGDFNGQPVAVTATVAGVVSGVDNTPGPTLEGVGLSLQYFQVFGNGSSDSLFAPPTSAGNYQVVATFAGSTDYASASSTPASFSIYQAAPTIAVNATSGDFNGQPVAVTATVAGVVAGVDDTPGPTLEGTGLTLQYYQLFANGGSDSLNAAPTSAGAGGNYEVVASFAGSTDYASSSQSTKFTIYQATPTIAVNATSGDFNGQPVAVTATVAGVVAGVDDTPGPTLEGTGLTLQYYIVFANGSEDSLNAPPTTPGNYLVVASFAGSTDYASTSSQAVSFTISKAIANIQLADAGGPFNELPYAATVTIAGVVAGVDDTPGQSLEGVFLSALDYQQLDANGNVEYDLGSTAPTFVGSYRVTVFFAGSADYASLTAETDFTIRSNGGS